MKKLFSILIAAGIFISLPASGYADGAKDFDCKNYSDFYDKNELAEVQNQIEGDYFTNEINSLENGVSAGYGVDNSENGSAYKIYEVTSVDFAEKLANNANIMELLPDNYSWIIPGKRTVAKVIFDDKENNWRNAGYTELLPQENNDIVQSNVVQFDKVNSAVENILLKETSEITNIVCVNAVAYFTNFVCIALTDKTYLIPFGSRPDLTGLTNGVLYSPNEVDKILKQTLGVDLDGVNNGGEMLNMVGGVGVNDTAKDKSVFPFLLIVIIPFVVIAVVIAVFLIGGKRLKHLHKNK